MTEVNGQAVAKKITASELTKFSLQFYHTMKGRIQGSEAEELDFPEGGYSYAITKDESGSAVLKANDREYPMSEASLAMLAAIMNRTELASHNGKNNVVPGLPASTPWYSISVGFLSGEAITATECPGFAGWLFPIAGFLNSYMEGFKAYRPASGPSPDGQSWNCACGQKNITSKFCGECGAKSPLAKHQ